MALLYEESFEGIYGSTPEWFPVNQDEKPWLNTTHAIENNGSPQALQRVTIAGGNTRAGRWRLSKDEPLFQGETYRTEVTIVKATEDDRITDESWYSVKMMIPSDGGAPDARKTSIMQWFEDGSDELTLRTLNGYCFLELQSVSGTVYRWDLFSTNWSTNQSAAGFTLHPLDEWNQFVFHINHKFDSSGFIIVYRNGVKIHEYHGQTIHEEVPKWKIGIYSSLTKSTVPYKIIYYDDIRVGNNTSNLTEMMGGTPPPPTNAAPTVNAGTDQVITLPTSTTTLIATANDSDGTIANRAWTKVSGPSGVTISSPSSLSTGLTGLVQGVYVFKITVTDDDGATASDLVQVTVNAAPPANVAPVSKAGVDQVITLPVNSVTVNGSGSTDSDGTVTNYLWTKVSGPSGGTITSSTSASTTITGLTEGTYVFNLRVTDDDGATHNDTMSVVVNPAIVIPNVPPTVNAGVNQTITLPTDSVTLTGTASDSDGTLVNTTWSKISGPAGGTIASPSSLSTTVSALQQGTYTFRLSATDDDGAITTDTMNVVVNPAPNVAPVVDAGENQTITLPVATVNLAGSASDSDGAIGSVVWSQTSGALATIANGTTLTPTITGLVEGTYVFKLTATDNLGKTTSDSVTITVLPAVEEPESEVFVRDLMLVDAHTEQDRFILEDGKSYSLSLLNLTKANIRANISVPVDRVEFSLVGPVTKNTYDKTCPHCLWGDNGDGNYYYGSWGPPPLGTYTLTVVPLIAGVKYEPYTIRFTFVA